MRLEKTTDNSPAGLQKIKRIYGGVPFSINLTQVLTFQFNVHKKLHPDSRDLKVK